MSDQNWLAVKIQRRYTKAKARKLVVKDDSAGCEELRKANGFDDDVFFAAIRNMFPERENTAFYCFRSLGDQPPVRWNPDLIDKCYQQKAVVMGPGYFKTDEFRRIYVATMLLR